MCQAKCKTIENDLAKGRVQPSDDSYSILSFCRFLEAALNGEVPSTSAVPKSHWDFYRKTVQLLADSGELPFDIEDLSDASFSEA